jgi:hypothetical protein
MCGKFSAMASWAQVVASAHQSRPMIAAAICAKAVIIAAAMVAVSSLMRRRRFIGAVS